MISMMIKECRVDLLPIVKGLVSEADKVKEAYGNYESYAVALGVEEIIAIEHREEIEEEQELSEIDMVYVHHLSNFGEVQVPTPAYCELIDLCKEDSIDPIPLDMNNTDFTEMYINTVKATEFVKEHRMAKKGMKKNFDLSSPEAFAISWDNYINKVKGYAKVSQKRERYIAEQIVDTSKYRGSILAVVEAERIKSIIDHIKAIENE